MKKQFLYFAFGAMLLAASACSKSDNKPVPPPSGGNNVDIRGSITGTQSWTSDKTYRLRGYVYVEDGATLNIEPGTKIISNRDSVGVLVVYMGGKINAKGTEQNPIVFTSAESDPKAGDLGGVMLVGKATGNGNHAVMEGHVDAGHAHFGGTDDADNSGVLQYVRIEYAGKAVDPGDEVNGLSLYTVGYGTTIDHIQVIRGLDDAFEFFGGAVNCKYLVAYNCADDDYDMDDGFHGKIQFAVSVKDPLFTDPKTGDNATDLSNNFEVDNTKATADFTSPDGKPTTHPILSNFTAIGPNNAPGTSVAYGYGMRWRRASQVVLANSIVLGCQQAGLVVEDAKTGDYYQSGLSKFYNSFLSAVKQPFYAKSAGTLTDDILENLTLGNDASQVFNDPQDVGLIDPFNNAKPGLQPKAGSKPLTVPAKFDLNELKDAFFTPVTYIGAFDGINDWTTGWTVWGK